MHAKRVEGLGLGCIGIVGCAGRLEDFTHSTLCRICSKDMSTDLPTSEF